MVWASEDVCSETVCWALCGICRASFGVFPAHLPQLPQRGRMPHVRVSAAHLLYLPAALEGRVPAVHSVYLFAVLEIWVPAARPLYLAAARERARAALSSLSQLGAALHCCGQRWAALQRFALPCSAK